MKINKFMRMSILIYCLLFLAFFLMGCNNKKEAGSEDSSEASIENLDIIPTLEYTEELLPIIKDTYYGEEFGSIEDLANMITEEDIEYLRNGDFTAAVCMHENYTQWAYVLNKGLSDTLEKFNIRVLAVSDGGMDVDKMASDLISLTDLKPDVIAIFNLSYDQLADTAKKVIDEGIKLEFYNIQTEGLQYPQDYGAIIVPDDYQMGYFSANALARKIGGSGKVAVLEYNIGRQDHDERTLGCIDSLKNFPDIEIVDIQIITDNKDAARKTEIILDEYPDIDAIWAAWDQPAMAAASVAENIGKDIYVTGPDIGSESAFSLASDGLFVETASQMPYLQGVAMALNIAVELAGKTPPKYILTPAVKVTKDNLPKAWELIFQEPLKENILEQLDG